MEAAKPRTHLHTRSRVQPRTEGSFLGLRTDDACVKGQRLPRPALLTEVPSFLGSSCPSCAFQHQQLWWNPPIASHLPPETLVHGSGHL